MKLVKLTVDIPADVEARLHYQARTAGIPKRELAGKLLDSGLKRYESDRPFRESIAPVASDGRLKLTGS